MKCINCGNEIDEGTLVCPNCNQPANVLTKRNGNGFKNIIIIILAIIIVLLAGALIYVIAFNNKDIAKHQENPDATSTALENSSTTTTTAVQLTRDEKVKINFLNDIEEVKKGEKVDYIICGEETDTDCTKIKEVTIDDLKYYADYDKDPLVYSISYIITCESGDSCFYNEQFDGEDGDSSNVLKGSSYYQVDEDGKIIKILGNSYPSVYLDEE